MLPSVRIPPAGMPLAHPLTEPFSLPFSPLTAAYAAAVLVLLVAFGWPRADGRGGDRSDTELSSWAGRLSALQLVTRAFAVALLVLAVTAGRLGADEELENVAPALVIGIAWPLVAVASVSLGAVWRWFDPWDGAARALTRDHPDEGPGHVWPAVLIAVPWVWYLSAYSDPLDPRSVGAILAVYTLFTLGGCVLVGRARWLSTSEPLGIVLSWMALLPRRRLGGWNPPRGAEALLGVLAGGVLFGAARRSELWGSLNVARSAELLAALGVIASCAAAAGLLILAAALAKRANADATVSRAAVPAVAGIILAVALDRNRLFTSVQLLPELLTDPFGKGWDPFGRAATRLDPAPLGTRGLLVAQLAVLTLGHVAGAVVLARGADRSARVTAAVAIAILVGAAVIAVASH